jgi:hypothetical protein
MLELDGQMMGALALGLFWIHVLLIAAAALADLRELGRLARRVATGSWAEVESARGPQGLLARQWVEQLGRLARRAGPREILFHDRAHHSEVFGGVLHTSSGTLELAPAAGDRAAVWPSLDERAARAAQPEPGRFDAAASAAAKAKGFEREVETRIEVGARVWVAGRVEDGKLAPDPTLIVSLADPRPWLARARMVVIGFVMLDVGVATLCTLLALWTPAFGLVSMLGAAGALGWFLGVQPLGVAVHDWVRTPDRAFLRGSWRE